MSRRAISMTWAWTGVMLWAAVASGNITPVSRGDVEAGTVLPLASSDVRVVAERLTVEMASPEGHAAPVVSVEARYTLRHEGAAPVELDIAFPLAGRFQQHFGLRAPAPLEGLEYAVELDGNPLEARADPIPLPRTMRTVGGSLYLHLGQDGPDTEEARRLRRAMMEWVSADPQLAEMLAEYTRIAPSWQAYSQAQAAFEAAVEPLLTRKYLRQQVWRYYRHPADWSIIRELAAEADPQLRRAISGAQSHYVSTLPDQAPGDAQEVKHLREQIDQWLAGRPQIAACWAPLVAEYDRQREARRLLDERIRPHLEGKAEIDAATVGRLVEYFESAYNRHPRGHNPEVGWAPPAAEVPVFPPDLWLASRISREIAEEHRRHIEQADALLNKYGFDATFLSPLTGRGYSRRVNWRDDSTWAILAFQAPATRAEQIAAGRRSFERDSYTTQLLEARSEAQLIRFRVSFKANQTRTLVVRYRALAEIDDLAMGQPARNQLVQFRYILKTARYWKAFGPIELVVRVPREGLVVMEPLAGEPKWTADGRLEYRTTLVDPKSNLRIAWLPADDLGRCTLFDLVKPSDRGDLQRLLQEIEHPQARRVLQALMARTGLPEYNRFEFPALYSGIFNLLAEGFPEELALNIGMGSSQGPGRYDAKEAKKLLAYVRKLAETGWRGRVHFDNPDHDPPFARPIYRWHIADCQAVADWIAREKIEPLTPEAELAQAYIKLLAIEAPTPEQCAAFLAIARREERLTTTAASLIADFPRDPGGLAALPLEVVARPKPADDAAAEQLSLIESTRALQIIRRKYPDNPALQQR